MLSIDEALTRLSETGKLHRIVDVETIAISEASGRIVAEDCIAPINVPPADNSAMDGYALFINEEPSNYPVTLDISQRIPAGNAPSPLITGTAARIFTGAEIPAGANCVVLQENCNATEKRVTINEGLRLEGNIRKCGQDIKLGSVAIATGAKLDAAAIGLLYSLGLSSVTVYRKLKVAIISTGDELVSAGAPLQAGQIYDSNRYMIEAQLKNLGADIVSSEHLPDDPSKIETALSNATEKADLVISSGGVSVGEEDHIKGIVEKLGTLDFWKVHMKPGKPLAFGRITNNGRSNSSFFIGLPGNPVSAFITLHLFGCTLARSLSGVDDALPKYHFQKSTFDIEGKARRPEFIRVKVKPNGIERFKNQSSGVLSSLVWADALAFIPTETEIHTGDFLRVYPLK